MKQFRLYFKRYGRPRYFFKRRRHEVAFNAHDTLPLSRNTAMATPDPQLAPVWKECEDRFGRRKFVLVDFKVPKLVTWSYCLYTRYYDCIG